MITLRQLRYLAALARHRHFGRAAEDCAISQPALSMQIRELERELGAELVERRPGDIILTGTPAGVGLARKEFLKPGDVVKLFVEGVGTLTNPMA